MPVCWGAICAISEMFTMNFRVHLCLIYIIHLLPYNSGQMGNYFLFQIPYFSQGSIFMHYYTASTSTPLTVLTISTMYPRKVLCNVTVSRASAGRCLVSTTHRQSGTGHIWSLALVSSGQFGVTATALSSGIIVDVMTLLPVEQFGKNYYLVTTDWTPSIVIIAVHDSTEISIRLINLRLVDRPLPVDGSNYTHNDRLNFLLNSQESFILQRCQLLGTDNFTGTSVYGEKPIGVVVGACKTMMRNCSSQNFLRMLEPVGNHGNEFIIVNLSLLDAEILVMTVEAKTNLNFELPEKRFSVLLATPGAIYKVNITQGDSGLLTSDKPVVCYLLYRRSCQKKVIALYPWLTAIHPNVLFYDAYLWSIRDHTQVPGRFHHYVTFIILAGREEMITLDGQLLSSSTVWSYVGQSVKWTTTRLSYVAEGTHEAKTAKAVPFVCYASTVHYSDSDSGELTTNVSWSYWGDWTCERECGPSGFQRTRSCDGDIIYNVQDIPCPGNSRETKPGECILHRLCPEDCPNGTYGMDCTGDCRRCVGACNKYNGSCSLCQPGWQSVHQGCSTECPKWTYGNSCRGLCEFKCSGQDCIDRVDGRCPEIASVLPILVVMMLIPYLIFLIFFFARETSGKNTQSDSPGVAIEKPQSRRRQRRKKFKGVKKNVFSIVEKKIDESTV